MTEPSSKKKYNNFENVLQYINKNTISLSDAEMKQNSNILNVVVQQVISKMKEKSATFKTLYEQIFYGGSYYDGLKTTKPEEYDLDLLFKLPKDVQVEVKSMPDHPGFVSLHVNGNTTTLKDFLDEENFVSRVKVLQWMESLLSKTLQEFPASGNKYIAQYDAGTEFYMCISKSGPAFTLKLNGMLNEQPVSFDVDLVPCFCFDDAHWPKDFRQNNTKEKTFFLVPKQPKTAETKAGVCWRLSFQKQERLLLSNNKMLKPSVRLLKKLRDKLQHVCISSYFIKTVFLWEVLHREKTFWDNSLSFVYMEMLKSYMTYIEDKNIPYFWNEGNNLLRGVAEITLQNVGNRLKRIYDDLNKNLDNPYCVANIYLSGDEIEAMKGEIILSKKCVKGALERSLTGDTSVESIETHGRNGDGSYESLVESMSKMSEDLAAVKDENRVLREMMGAVLSKLDSLEIYCQQIIAEKQFVAVRSDE